LVKCWWAYARCTKIYVLADCYQGQRVFVIPSKYLVVVRLNVTYGKLKYLLKQSKIQPHENKDVVEFELNNIDYNNLIKEILSTIE